MWLVQITGHSHWSAILLVQSAKAARGEREVNDWEGEKGLTRKAVGYSETAGRATGG